MGVAAWTSEEQIPRRCAPRDDTVLDGGLSLLGCRCLQSKEMETEHRPGACCSKGDRPEGCRYLRKGGTSAVRYFAMLGTRDSQNRRRPGGLSSLGQRLHYFRAGGDSGLAEQTHGTTSVPWLLRQAAGLWLGTRDSQNQSTPAGLIPSVAAWFRRLKPAAIHGKPLRGRKAHETRVRNGGQMPALPGLRYVVAAPSGQARADPSGARRLLGMTVWGVGCARGDSAGGLSLLGCRYVRTGEEQIPRALPAAPLGETTLTCPKRHQYVVSSRDDTVWGGWRCLAVATWQKTAALL